MVRMTGNKAKVEGEDEYIWGLQMWNKRLWEKGGNGKGEESHL